MIRRKTLEKETWQIELEKLPDEINVVGYYTPDKYKANPRLGVFGVCYGDTFKMSDIFNRDAFRPKKGFDETVMFIGLEKGSYGQRPSSYVAWFKMQSKDESLVRTDGSILGRGMLVSSVIKNRMIERVIPGPFHGHIVQVDDKEIDS